MSGLFVSVVTGEDKICVVYQLKLYVVIDATFKMQCILHVKMALQGKQKFSKL